jgi:hypothetical protein
LLIVIIVVGGFGFRFPDTLWSGNPNLSGNHVTEERVQWLIIDLLFAQSFDSIRLYQTPYDTVFNIYEIYVAFSDNLIDWREFDLILTDGWTDVLNPHTSPSPTPSQPAVTCSCTQDGFSGGVRTELGCAKHSSSLRNMCYTEGGVACQLGHPSVRFPGAAYSYCQSELFCLDSPSFSTAYGGCSSYSPIGPNYGNCKADGASEECPLACRNCVPGMSPDTDFISIFQCISVLFYFSMLIHLLSFHFETR